MKNFLIYLSLIIVVSSCSQPPIQTINIHPDLSYLNDLNIGNFKQVEVLVFDLRVNKGFIGHKKYGSQMVDLRADSDVANILQDSLAQGLRKNGFEIGKGRVFEVHLIDLSYDAKRSLVGESEAKIDLKVILRDQKSNMSFNKNYKISLSNKHFIAPSPEADYEIINLIINEAIKNILNDKNLLGLLAR